MNFSKPVTEIIQKRYSCRSYLTRPIAEDLQRTLADFMAANQTGPFGTSSRFKLVAAQEGDDRALKGLGTYGFIKNPTGFIVGAMGQGEKNLEDFGYLMELSILHATDLGLGTCWLGGSFTKSRFAKKIATYNGESVPAVTSVGYIADKPRRLDGMIRQGVEGAHRLPWETLFFDRLFGVPLDEEPAGEYATPLEMVRLGPSASNKQPWRIVRDNRAWHFYMQRTPGYRDGFMMKLMRVADIQRLDMGIAMSHFELTASELGLPGEWVVNEPAIAKPDELTEYVVSWV